MIYFLEDRFYTDLQSFGEEIVGLKDPWNDHFTLTGFDDTEINLTDENWIMEPVFEHDDIACLQATSAAPTEIIRNVFASAVILVQKTGQGPEFRVSDIILRDGGGYNRRDCD